MTTTSCPGCGAPLEFRNAGTLTVVCASCGGASYRTDVDLSFLGKVSAVADIESAIELGSTGRLDGKGFTCVGQLQLDHGSGPWNEWCLLFDDGSWAWYAEAQGETVLTRDAGAPDASLPAWADVHPGTGIEVAGRRFVVAEIGEGRVTAMRGEIPVRRTPGSRFRYADLRAGDGDFGTLDYGTTERCEAVYVGRTVEPGSLGLSKRDTVPAEKRAQAARLACGKCGGAVELRDAASLRVVCGHCGSLLDPASGTARVIGIGAALSSKPLIPIGARGTLDGVAVEVLAFLVRSVESDGVRYPWSEYLLRTARGGYRWLAESHRHWAVLDPVNPAQVTRGPSGPMLRGKSFRHFQGGEARVDHVQGEVYWRVEIGETVKSDDYVEPPYLLTIESSGKERNVTAGRYVARGEIEAAFGVKLADPFGVAPAQPNPYLGEPGRWWATAGIFVAVFVVLAIWVGSVKGSNRVGLFFPGLFVLGGILIPPIVVSTKRAGFEVRRWQDSDHPLGSSE